MKPEAKVLGQIVSRLSVMRKTGEQVWFAKLHGGPIQRAGLPDLVVCWRGVTYWLEVKSDAGQPSRLQVEILGRIAAAGCPAHVVRSVADLERILALPTHRGEKEEVKC